MSSTFNGTLLSGKAALVTGGAGAIGCAIAKELASAGAQVIVIDNNREVEKTAAGIRVAGGLVADVTDQGQVAEVVKEAISRLGKIDILVNCHGILTEATLSRMSLETWNKTIQVDLTGVFLMCRAVLPNMLERHSGRIINVASQLGIKGGPGMAHYAAAKAGVIAMSKSLALEVSGQGVLVNCLAPGPIETALIADVSAEWRKRKQAELPLGRFGRPEEIAPTVVLLASEPGGNLYVGQSLGPNSGDVMP